MSLQTPKNRKLRLCSREESREIDEVTIRDYGMAGSVLMEIAGLKASEIIKEHVGPGSHGIYFCGKGNNAGDAFVIARYLTDLPNHQITIVLAAGSEQLSNDAQTNFSLLKKLAEHNPRIEIVDKASDDLISRADYIIDGMIGTGLNSDLRDPLLSCAEQINRSHSTIFALDIPTGLDCDSGEILGSCVNSDHTITFGTNKIGFYLGSGPDVTGQIHFVELPFPEYLRSHSATLIEPELEAESSPEADPAAHKYDRGTVHIIAGSAGMTGAAIMSAKSAWNAGAGAVFLYAPKGILQVYEQTLPQIIKVPLGTDNDDHYNITHAETVIENMKAKPGPVLLGPGAGRSPETTALIERVIKFAEGPIIIDADGLFDWNSILNALSGRQDWIITPHIGELKHSVGLEFTTDFERLDAAEKLSKQCGCILLSKGYPTIVCTPDDGTYITGYDTRIFSKAGFGDVLSGTIAGKLAVSKNKTESVIRSLLDNFKSVQHTAYPEPRHIYDR